MSASPASPAPTSPSPPPPDNIFKLKQTLNDLIQTLQKHDEIDIVVKEVNTFFKSGYIPSSHTATELADNETKIKSIEEFDTRYSDFVTACERYVNSAQAIFGGLDSSITDLQTLIDDKFFSELTKTLTDNFNKEIVPITDVINALKISVPDASGGGTPLTDIQLEKMNI